MTPSVSWQRGPEMIIALRRIFYLPSIVLLASSAGLAWDLGIGTGMAGDVHGGSVFIDEPTAFRPLVGVVIRAANAVDAFQSIYQLPGGSLSYGPNHGGSGGAQYYFWLNNNEFITGIWGFASPNIRCIGFTTNMRQMACWGREEGTFFRISLSSKDGFRGFVGRSGQMLDAIGFY